ncbi:MAG: diphthamide synthesis protein [Vulcanisaeta sp.]|uniref:2-(3-amino-3-carboxypropyl)histidine synthase n=1 Tax=Vulcanisaeta moutnovskia (strain 768-28) TaxID=985053 RepID=F0QTG6_VULM7|nr:diphthamide synthesis protein [Vulcanisaeta moutnovskia]ADY00508.1 diphthamide biosynthesis protein [Vulcanisaeta moutnovskia 768-28]
MSYNGELTEILDTYLLPLKSIEEVINENRNAKILIETPLGFKNVGLEVVRYLSNKGFRAYLSGQNVWGTCDFSVSNDYQYIIHLGHALPPNIFRIINNNYRLERQELNDAVIIRIKNGPTVLFSAIYYEPKPDLLDKLREPVNNIIKSNPNALITYALPYKLYAYSIAKTLNARIAPGPITGCFVQFPIPNTILFIGSGYFYPLTFKLLKPQTTVYSIDIFRGIIEDVDYIYRKYLTMKVKAIHEFNNAKFVGIVISRKPGQYRLDLIEPLINRLKKLGKGYVIIDLNEVSPDYINNLPVDAVINTACPRIGIDDLDRFIKPVVNAGDILKLNVLDLNNLLVW